MSLRSVEKLDLRLSVIVSTYNNPRALTLVLASLANQTARDFEVIVADDGSGTDTRAAVDDFARDAPFALRHVWQPDDGFRKCAILNKAICAASGNYLIFFDGDCIAPARTVAAHVAAARPHTYLSGGKVLLGAQLTQSLTVDDIRRGRLDHIGLWWRQVGKLRRLMINRLPGLRTVFDRNVPRPPTWRGENSSTFAEYVLRVGGFDERFTYGHEDADFGQRLRTSGITPRSLRYSAPVLHLDHGRPYFRQDEWERNRDLLFANHAALMTFTPYGIQPSHRAGSTD